MKSLIIEVDAYKPMVPGYEPKKSWKYHKQSAKLADAAFKQALKNAQYKKVVLMCGGSASGKSEFASSSLINEGVIVYDGTLSSVEGAKVKIRNSKRKRKRIEINAIIPDNINHEIDPKIIPMLVPLIRNKNPNTTIENIDAIIIIVGEETTIVTKNIINNAAMA